MRAFQSRRGLMVTSPKVSAFPAFPTSSSRNLTTSSSAANCRPTATNSRGGAGSGIYSLVAPSSMGLFAQRRSMADTTKAVAGMSGYGDIAYNEESDKFIQAIEEAVAEFEEKDDGKIEDVDYQAGVLNVQTHKGTFILNKQAPKLQLWLSSPISGPTHWSMIKGTEDDPDKIWWKCDRTGKDLQTLLTTELGSVLGLDGPLELNL